MTPPSVVFVCGRNAVRSPMAEALWRRRFGAGSRAASCGVEAASLPDGYMIAVMAELGLDLSGFLPRSMADAASEAPELVVCLARDADAPALRFAEDHGARHVLWPIDDPTLVQGDRAAVLAAYRAARDAIAQRILAF